MAEERERDPGTVTGDDQARRPAKEKGTAADVAPGSTDRDVATDAAGGSGGTTGGAAAAREAGLPAQAGPGSETDTSTET